MSSAQVPGQKKIKKSYAANLELRERAEGINGFSLNFISLFICDELFNVQRPECFKGYNVLSSKQLYAL